MNIAKRWLFVVLLAWSFLLAATVDAAGQAPAATAPAQKKAVPRKAPARTAPGRAREWFELKPPPLRDITLPEIRRYTLANGIKLFVIEDHTLPLVDGSALIRAGSRWEPPDKVGLASITGSVMRTGGTKTRTGDELDEILEGMAASVETSIGSGSGGASFSALKGDEQKVLEIFADVLMNPEFRQDKIDLAKVQARTAISRRNDDPGSISSREFRKLLYGEESPYARHAEYATIAAITREHLIEFHRRFYHPNNLMIGIVGDVDAEQVRGLVEKAFAAWKPAPGLEAPPVPPADAAGRPRVSLVQKSDVNQASIRIGHLDGLMSDPDFFALEVMSQVLASGGFSSRITRKVRSQMGLAYAAGGSWSAGYDHKGAFSVFVGTKSETTTKAIEAVLHEIEEIRRAEPTEEELQVAKESILNSFVFNFVHASQILSRVMTYEYYGYPADFLEQYKTNIEKVTRADVLRVAKQHLHPDRLAVLVVGNEKEFDRPLAQLALAGGKVNTIDVTIPEPAAAAASAAPAATAESLERGRALFALAQRGMGGAERLRAVRDVAVRASGSVFTPQGRFPITVSETIIFPSVVRSQQVLPFGTLASFFDGAAGWVQTPEGVGDMGDDRKRAAREELARNTENLLRGEGEFTAQAVGSEKVGEREAEILLIRKEGQDVRLWVEPASGRILKKGYIAPSPMGGGPAQFEEVYSDFRERDGVPTPFGLTINLDGALFGEFKVEELKINTGVQAADLGKKPE